MCDAISGMSALPLNAAAVCFIKSCLAVSIFFSSWKEVARGNSRSFGNPHNNSPAYV
jgi:hypothetical protein